jgi:hypothetical protein
MSKSINKIATLEWLVKNRSRNQACAVKLFKLLTERESQIKLQRSDMFVQGLIGVTFSLWRAVFLADKRGIRAESLKSATEFLETMIADNAIGYIQDKKFKEWTFNYYTNNVRLTLINLHNTRPGIVPEWGNKKRLPSRSRRNAHLLPATSNTACTVFECVFVSRAAASIPMPSAKRFTIRVAFLKGILSLPSGRYGISEKVLRHELQR